MVLVFTILLLEVESPDIVARMQRGSESPEGEEGAGKMQGRDTSVL